MFTLANNNLQPLHTASVGPVPPIIGIESAPNRARSGPYQFMPSPLPDSSTPAYSATNQLTHDPNDPASMHMHMAS